jgi:hypothetical protein
MARRPGAARDRGRAVALVSGAGEPPAASTATNGPGLDAALVEGTGDADHRGTAPPLSPTGTATRTPWASMPATPNLGAVIDRHPQVERVQSATSTAILRRWHGTIAATAERGPPSRWTCARPSLGGTSSRRPSPHWWTPATGW